MTFFIPESFVWWKVVEYTVPYLNKELRKIHFTYVNSIASGEWSCQRSIRCGYVASELMGIMLYYQLNISKSYIPM